MKLLFTADLHGHDKAFSDLATELINSFDLGVLGGDLMTYPSDEKLRLAKRQLESENVEVTDLYGPNNPQVVERALRLEFYDVLERRHLGRWQFPKRIPRRSAGRLWAHLHIRSRSEYIYRSV
jgi:Icc-related predicted phosphoesterase